ncbi:glycine betaine uptake BCCT transporter [Bacillus fonticola]|uniref:glycine betaine uptake BCCT transporter n=1 Tax=Bacillus fonticola TaxID=2728853 RepID=UPI001476323F|nr:BCCT family transporter [Bacillus fonticola]
MKKLTPVFTISVTLAVLFIIWGLIPETVLQNASLRAVTQVVNDVILDQFGWFYMISTTIFLGFVLFLIFSKYGSIRLGQDDEKPEYSYLSWFAMLFSAGMGIGLVFWGAGEPMFHYYYPPTGEAATAQAAEDAIRYSFFHWGLHPWAVYAVIALALAYFQFRKRKPGVISTLVEPVLGDRAQGGIGKLVDILAVFATIFGVATSLGIGAAQISGGLNYVNGGIPNTFSTQLIIIAVVTVLFLLSAQTGLNRGIKYLSNVNIILALLLMLFVFILGPTNYILQLFSTAFGKYLQTLPDMSLRLAPFDPDNSWYKDWPIFYWAWWISWSPFVGSFIARVSKGRTVREFIIGVLGVPTIFGAIWFSVFGGSAIYFDFFENSSILGPIESIGEEVALFALFENFPLTMLISILAIFLISTFFITSADSATFVLGMLTTNGSLNPPNSVKFVWGLIISATAAILLSIGGLAALQRASIIAALPFTVVLLLIVISLVKAFAKEMKND